MATKEVIVLSVRWPAVDATGTLDKLLWQWPSEVLVLFARSTVRKGPCGFEVPPAQGQTCEPEPGSPKSQLSPYLINVAYR